MTITELRTDPLTPQELTEIGFVRFVKAVQITPQQILLVLELWEKACQVGFEESKLFSCIKSQSETYTKLNREYKQLNREQRETELGFSRQYLARLKRPIKEQMTLALNMRGAAHSILAYLHYGRRA